MFRMRLSGREAGKPMRDDAYKAAIARNLVRQALEKLRAQ